MLLSAGIVPVSRGTSNKFLLLRVYKYWDFPKGVVEAGEDPMTAAVRELFEETGLAKPEFPWGKNFVETLPYRGKIARYYLGTVTSTDVIFGLNPQLGRAEHHEYRWVTLEEGKQLLVPRVCEVLEWAAARI